MGKNSRKRKRQLLAQATVGRGDSVPGGLQGALFRNYNGAATPADIDFLTRMSRESKGKDGYTSMTKPNGKAKDGVFHTVYGPSTHQTKDEHVFHCAEANEITSKCPLNPDVPDILVPITMWECFLACCKEYDTEWIALLKGKMGKDEKDKPAYIIESFYFPPQVASGAHVDVPTGVQPKPGTIGAIHSHVDMGVFWSGTDTAHSNWPVEIVINRREAYEALSRYQLKCGEWAKGKATVRLTGAWVSRAVDNLVQAAFNSGNALATKARASKIPAGVAKEDRAEVASAVVKGTVTSISTSPRCKSCDHISHFPGEACKAVIGGEPCKCVTYVPASDACPTCKSGFRYARIGPCADSWHSFTTITRSRTVCPTPECVRDDDHLGWHQRADKTYFRTELGKIVEDDRKPVTEDSDNLIEWPHQEQLSLTVPASDDGPADDLAEDEYCPMCEGYTYVEEVINGKTEIRNCPTCLQTNGKSDGLSPAGRAKAAEGMGVN